MTANLTVPADIWACQQPGVPLVAAIVEGDLRCRSCGLLTDGEFGDRGNVCHCLSEPHHNDLVAPADLVALRDARCECVDAGTPGWIGPPENLTPCPRCHDGRLLHDVRVECEHPADHGDVPDRRRCLMAACLGYRTVRCLVDVVEVVGRQSTMTTRDGTWLAVWPTGTVAMQECDMVHLTTHPALTLAHVEALAAACGKPPADWPGGYAVILTEAGQ